MAQKTIQSTVAFTDSQGNAFAAGFLTLDLSQPCIVTVGGGDVSTTRIVITLDSTGKIPASTTIWANDQLSPSNTTYRVRLYDVNGNLMADFGNWALTGASPIDVSQIVPTLAA